MMPRSNAMPRKSRAESGGEGCAEAPSEWLMRGRMLVVAGVAISRMPLSTRLWFSMAALVIATLMPVNPLTVLLIFALALDALVGVLLARDLGEGRHR